MESYGKAQKLWGYPFFFKIFNFIFHDIDLNKSGEKCLKLYMCFKNTCQITKLKEENEYIHYITPTISMLLVTSFFDVHDLM